MNNQNTAVEALPSQLQQNSEEAQKLTDDSRKFKLAKNYPNSTGNILVSSVECRETRKKKVKSCTATDTPIKQQFEKATKK